MVVFAPADHTVVRLWSPPPSSYVAGLGKAEQGVYNEGLLLCELVIIFIIVKVAKIGYKLFLVVEKDGGYIVRFTWVGDKDLHA